MRTLLLALLLVPATFVLAAPASAEGSLPCQVTYHQVYLDMDHPTNVPDGVQCESCHVTYHQVYLDMDHATNVSDGVECA